MMYRRQRDLLCICRILTHDAALATIMLCVAATPAKAGFLAPPTDQTLLAIVINRVLETERTATSVPWNNPETGTHGVIVVERTFYRGADRPCRDYRRTIEDRDGTVETVHGTGCRIGSGLWAIDERHMGTPSDVGSSDDTRGRTKAPQPDETAGTSKPTPDDSATTNKAAVRPKPKPPAAPDALKEEGTEQVDSGSQVEKHPFPDYTLPKRAEF